MGGSNTYQKSREEAILQTKETIDLTNLMNPHKKQRQT